MEFGTYTFADVVPAPGESLAAASQRRLQQLLEEIEIADRVGLDVFGVGEHHRADYAVSAPAVALAAGAARTERIRLTSAVTVLSSDDPVRVFQDFAELDLLSGGRAEIMAGRGSFTESFPLFGHDLDDYDELFAEKLDLLLALRGQERVTWTGLHREALVDQPVYPRPVQQPLPVWVAVGGNPRSVIRAGALGLPLAIAIIGGQPVRFAPLAQLHRHAAEEAGHDPSTLAVSINAHGLVADDDATAVRTFAGPYREMMAKLGRERGWPPMTSEQYQAALAPEGHLLVGSPETVAAKILHHHRHFDHDRFLMQSSLGSMPHAAVLRSTELLGTAVARLVDDGLITATASAGPAAP
ncbi:MAG: luciferase [Solirubrobacterales bacterium]|nr:luciferase [Solirubrobacterales bacterium]